MGERLMIDGMQTQTVLSAAFEPLTAAAMRGQYDLLLAEAERTVERLFPLVSAKMLVRTGGAWHSATCLEHGPGEDPPTWPLELDQCVTVARVGDAVFVPVTNGALGLWVQGAVDGLVVAPELPLLRQFVAIAVQTCERQRIAAQNLDEVQSLQRVATRILKSHDLGEILLLITQEAKRLLSADICGVMLLESGQLVMKRCVGNRAPETANLRMGPGKGLAGLVLADGRPASVEDYLNSDIISRDFFHLAEAELVRSALAAPLTCQGKVIGVLEVWRRRPSVFTPLDTMRLVALSNLTSIAIENAELLAEQRRMVNELSQAHAALNERYDMVHKVSALSQALMQQVLQGVTLQSLVTSVAEFLGSTVAALSLDGTLIASAGGSETADELASVVRCAGTRVAAGYWANAARTRWRVQPVVVEGETLKWAIARVADRGEAPTELALVQLATLAALQRLEQRAASRARSETIDALVWDLLQGDESARAAAVDRASELKLDFAGPLRLVLIELGPAAADSAERSSSALRQLLGREVQAIRPQGVVAAAVQGTSMAVICVDQATDDVERFSQRLARQMSGCLDGRLVVVGASSSCSTARSLSTAYREAQIALDVARQFGYPGAVVYDRAGVVGMLLSLRHETGMRRFLELNLGALLAEEERQREMLLKTLRVFFDVNCSHEAASQHLGVHRKTIGHRLARISELTGLDFTTHDDRLVADLSLYVYRLLQRRQDGTDS
jgi:sugar diacid utilization regulator/putative methionine-R-sulfoxide reductase with GAF domain